MKKLSIKIVCFIISAIMILPNCTYASAAEIAPAIEYNEEIEVVQGSDIICNSVSIWDGGNYICITEEITGSNSAVPYAYPEREKTASFKHIIHDRNGVLIANFISTVKGIYSDADNYAMITSVTGYYEDAILSGLSYRTTYSGDTATVYITLNGVAIGSITYKQYINGRLLEI